MPAPSRHLILLFCTMLLLACNTTPPNLNAPQGVAAITLKLQALTTGKRYSYFELSPNGDLSYGGGFDAINRNAKLVTTLTPQQLYQLQTYIEQSNLLTAKVSGNQSRKVATTVHHELSLRVDAKNRNLVVNDDQVPAVARLHDMLFEIYAKARYNLPGIGK